MASRLSSGIGRTVIVTPDYVSSAQAAVLLGVSRQHVWNLVQRGELPAIRVGRSLRIPLSALRRLPPARAA